MKKKVFDFFGNLIARRHIALLFVFLIITGLSVYIASGMKVKMSFKDLMPRDDPTVIELERIIDHFSSSSNLILAVSGDEKELVEFAERVAPQIEAIKPEIKRVDYTSDRDFLSQHGFMLMTTSDLKNMRDMFKDLGFLQFLTAINDNFEKTYIEDDEGLSDSEKEDRAVQSLDGIRGYLMTMRQYLDSASIPESTLGEEAAERFLLGEPYYLSPERDMILIFAQPSFPIDDMDTVISVVNRVDSLVTAEMQHFPSLDGGLTGTMTLARDETIAAQEDMNYTSIISFVLIILLFIFSFRMVTAPLLAGISLIVGVIWAGALTQLVYGHLNMMTSMFAVVLMGLGIDFNIHVISAYQDARSRGDSPGQAVLAMYHHSGNGIVIGALTTALAFLTMMVSKNSGMKEFGFVAGSGVLLTMVSALIVLPPMLILRERFGSKKKQKKEIKAVSFTFLGSVSAYVAKHRWVAFILTILITGFFLMQAMNISFNYNYLDLEPKGLSSVDIQDKVIDKYDLTTDMFMVTTETVQGSREIADKAKKLKSVGMVSSISSFVPSTLEQEERKPLIEAIRSDLTNDKTTPLNPDDKDAVIDQLYRLEDNIIELSQLSFMGGQDKVDRKAKTITGDLELPSEQRNSLVQGVVRGIEQRSEAISRLQSFQDAFKPRLNDIAPRYDRHRDHHSRSASREHPEPLHQQGRKPVSGHDLSPSAGLGFRLPQGPPNPYARDRSQDHRYAACVLYPDPVHRQGRTPGRDADHRRGVPASSDRFPQPEKDPHRAGTALLRRGLDGGDHEAGRDAAQHSKPDGRAADPRHGDRRRRAHPQSIQRGGQKEYSIDLHQYGQGSAAHLADHHAGVRLDGIRDHARTRQSGRDAVHRNRRVLRDHAAGHSRNAGDIRQEEMRNQLPNVRAGA